MKVLFICHPESDYGGGFLFSGLCDVLGDKNVYDYPLKPSYHGQVHNYSILPHIVDGHTGPAAWEVSHGYAYSNVAEPHGEIRDLIHTKGFDFCVVESLRSGAVSNFCGLRDELRHAGIPVVLHDGEDHPFLLSCARGSNIKAIDFALILKRELWKNTYPSPEFDFEGTKVIGFPFSAVSTSIVRAISTVEKEKELEISFLAGRTCDERQHVADALRDSGFDSYVAIAPDDRNSPVTLKCWEHYIATMRDSKIAVSVRGFGLDTVRFWESPLCTLMLTDLPELHYVNPLVDGVHCVRFSGAHDCVVKARDLLEDEERRRTIFDAGRRFVMEHHTNHARAQYLIHTLRAMGRIA